MNFLIILLIYINYYHIDIFKYLYIMSFNTIYTLKIFLLLIFIYNLKTNYRKFFYHMFEK